jgi:hypothetical protein
MPSTRFLTSYGGGAMSLSLFMSLSLLKNEPKGMRVAISVSLVSHSAILVAILLCFPSHGSSSPEVIPISVATIGESEIPGSQVSPRPELGFAHGSVFLKSKPTSPSTQAKAKQTVVVAKPPPEGNQPSVSQMSHSVASNQSDIPAEAWAEPQDARSEAGSGQPLATSETYLYHKTSTANAGFVEEQSGQPPGLTITRRADWQAKPVEDNKLTYSVPGSSVKFTMREVHSAGFAESALATGFGMQADENSGVLGSTPVLWGAAAMARSQKVDWTLVNLKNFGVTAFGYQNEVGSNFKSFGQTKHEFGAAGSTTLKAGGQVRVGPFGFGFAQSSREQLAWSGFQGVETGANLAAVQQEASVTLDLAQLLPNKEASGLSTKLLPTLWVTTSNEHTSTSGQEAVPRGTVSTSFGGTWAWDMGQATLGYWNYSSSGVAASAWSGQGFDASFALYHSSFSVDADLSYGHSEDVAPSWQSAGSLYGSSVTISYTPAKFPGLWASAAAGNYDQSAITFDGTSSALSNMYRASSNGEYWSIAAGVDLKRWFWTASDSGAPTGQLSSVKLLYRYTDSLYLDKSTGAERDVDSLVAVMIQRTF